MKKMKIRKKTMLELMRASRVQVTMNTAQKLILPEKGKGSYRRKVKHYKRIEE